MRANIGAPLSVEDYEKADRIILLLIQPQVKQMLDATPIGKKKAKNVPKGMRTIPPEFSARPLAGPEHTTNLVSISPFKLDGIYYTKGRFGKQLNEDSGYGQARYTTSHV